MKKNVFLRDAVGRFVRHRVAMVSLIILVLEILSILLLPLILDLDPFTS